MVDENENRNDDDEEEMDDTNYIAQKDAVLFAIDVSESMLTPPPEGTKERDSPTRAALKCAYQIMQQRIISNPKDMMGVLLYGTEASKFQEEDTNNRGGIAYPHCYLLSDLNVPDAADVKTLRGIVGEEVDNIEILKPTKQSVSMSNMLFCANQIFTTRAPNFGSRRLFIITDKDDPHAADKNLRSQAAVRAKDLYDLGVVIELFPISHEDHEFDRTKFYDDIIYRDPAEGEEASLTRPNFDASGTGGISLLNNLISDVNSKQVAKRTLFSNLPFEIAPGFKISVQGYNLLQKQEPARSCFIFEGADVAQIVTGESAKMEEDTARTVEKVEIKKAYKFGGSHVLFTPEEQKELKLFGTPILRIIGFKPQSMLPIWASVKKSTFIYPSEEHYVGSTRVFAALWKKLLKDRLMGVAWYIARANASPLLVAILPSQESVDEATKIGHAPAGLWLFPLPFADDIRKTPEVPKPIVATDALIDNMRKVVQQLQLPGATYNPSKYPNPALQWHYRILQAMAMEDELPEKPEDKSIPKYRQIDKRAGEYLQKWGEILDKEVRLYQKETYGGIDGTSLKRGNDGAEPPQKRIKSSSSKQDLENMSSEDLKKTVTAGGLGKYTVTELKDFLNLKDQKASGKKVELVDRVERWIEDN